MYNPIFAWSNGSAGLSVTHIEALYATMAKCCIIDARYDVEELGTPESNENLVISLPDGIVPLYSSFCMLSEYQTVNEPPEVLGIRTDHRASKLYLVQGIGGNYSAPYIKTGYQGFHIMFLTE